MKLFRLFIIIMPLLLLAQPDFHEKGRFGGTGTDSGRLKNPSALDISGDGRVFVCDRGNNRIQVFDLKGKYQKNIGGFGWENEQFDEPLDIWARSTINIWIADYNNRRVQRFDKDLNFLSAMYSSDGNSPAFQYREVQSLVYSPQGDLFLLDAGEYKIIKFNSRNQGEVAFGYYESGGGELIDPVQIELNTQNRLFVSDAAAKTILIFDYFGNYTGRIDHPQFETPSGLAVSPFAHLFVADPQAGKIFIFDERGNPLSVISELAGESFKRPQDIAVYARSAEDFDVYIIDGDWIRIAGLKLNVPKE